jgi:hypothetical protein
VGGGAYYLNISPLGYTSLTDTHLFCPSAAGIFFPTSDQPSENPTGPSDTYRFLPYEEINRLDTDGRSVRINDQAVYKAASPVRAKAIARLIDTVRTSPEAKRQTIVKSHLKESTDLAQLAARATEMGSALFYLKVLCTLLFFDTFLLLPLALYTPLFYYFNLPHLLLTMGLLYLTILCGAGYLYRQIYHVSWGQIVIEMISLLLSPVAAIQAFTHLTKNLYVHFDYLAVATYLLPVAGKESLLRAELYRLDQAKADQSPPALDAFWQLRAEILDQLLTQAGLSRDQLFSPPPQEDESMHSYCPICLAQHRAGFTTCKDCQVSLKTLT